MGPDDTQTPPKHFWALKFKRFIYLLFSYLRTVQYLSRKHLA